MGIVVDRHLIQPDANETLHVLISRETFAAYKFIPYFSGNWPASSFLNQLEGGAVLALPQE
jgi:hypothetical protein